jgi:putative oxidoreductase
MARRIPPPVVDVVLLLARVAIGVIFVAHGWQKLHTWGIDGTQHAFRGMGVPAPSISALYAIAAELIGGVLLIAGVLMPIAVGTGRYSVDGLLRRRSSAAVR